MVHSQSLNPFQEATFGRKSGASNRSLSSLRGSSESLDANHPDWLLLPDEVVLHIFSFVGARDLAWCVVRVCKGWHAVGTDESLWKGILCRRWKLDVRKVKLPAHAVGWRAEYGKLHNALPRRTVQTLAEHTDEVLHVAFSNGGRYIASCSKDRTAILWECYSSHSDVPPSSLGLPIPSIITSNPLTSAAVGFGGMARGAINNISAGIAVGLGSSPPRAVPAFTQGGTSEAAEWSSPGAGDGSLPRGGSGGPTGHDHAAIVRVHRKILLDNPTEYAEFNAEDTMVLIATANYANNYGAVHICRVSDAVVFHRVNMFPFDVMSAWAPGNHFVTAITRGLASTASEIYTWWVSSDPEEDLTFMQRDFVPIDRGSCARRILVADLRRAERLAALRLRLSTQPVESDPPPHSDVTHAPNAASRAGARLGALASSILYAGSEGVRRARRASLSDIGAIASNSNSGSLSSSNSTSTSSVEEAVARSVPGHIMDTLGSVPMNVTELISGFLSRRSRSRSVSSLNNAEHTATTAAAAADSSARERANAPARTRTSPRGRNGAGIGEPRLRGSVASSQSSTHSSRASLRARSADDGGRLLLIYQTGEKLNRIGLKEISAPDVRFADRPLTDGDVDQGDASVGCVFITETGPIIGMSLSPDHTQLVVNVRPFIRNSDVPGDSVTPLISEAIEVHVWDLATRTMVRQLSGHRAFTPADAPFIIWVGLGGEHDDIVVSGAEDGCGHMWHKHYGAYLGRLEGHQDVVNAAACNPADPRMIITASDDFTLRVWR
eukprot:Opistho-2@59041